MAEYRRPSIMAENRRPSSIIVETFSADWLVLWNAILPQFQSGLSNNSVEFEYQGFKSCFRITYNPKGEGEGYYSTHIVNLEGKDYFPFEITSYIDDPEGPICSWRQYVEDTSPYLNVFSLSDIVCRETNFRMPRTLTFGFILHGELGRTFKYKGNDLSIPDLENLSHDMERLMLDNSSQDTTIKCGKRTFRVHNNIISCRSLTLAKMCSEKARGRPLEIWDIDEDTMEDVIKYIYTERIQSEMTPERTRLLHEAADKLAVGNLKKICANHLIRILDTKTAYQTLSFSSSCNDEFLKEKVISFILFNQMPLQKEEFLLFRKDYPNLACDILYTAYLARHNV